MLKEELDELVYAEKIMSMQELKLILKRKGKLMSQDAIIKAIADDEIKEIGSNEVLEKKEVKKYLKRYSASTAQRQIEDLREGKQVRGPVPTDLTKKVKVYYPASEVAAVMYIESHTATGYGKTSLKRILETRHD